MFFAVVRFGHLAPTTLPCLLYRQTCTSTKRAETLKEGRGSNVAVFADGGGEIGGNSNEAICWVLLNTLVILPSVKIREFFVYGWESLLDSLECEW
jgi:hypothetical protein